MEESATHQRARTGGPNRDGDGCDNTVSFDPPIEV